MAAIEKIYGTTEQYRELERWLGRNKPKFLRNLYPYPDNPVEGNITISHFSEAEDHWLLAYCPIEWVRVYICRQYAYIPEENYDE